MEERLAVVGVPGVRVRVEQDDRDRPARGRRVCSQLPERDRVVASEDDRDDPARQQRLEPGRDLLSGSLGVSGRHFEVAVVDHRPRGEHVHLQLGIPRPQQCRRRADGLGTEARAWPEARGGVERDADDGDVHVVELSHVRAAREGAHARVARRRGRVRRAVARAGLRAHSATTRTVRSRRSLAPRRLPPCSSARCT